MSVIICERCGKRYKASDALAGKAISCPSCGASLTVPPLELPSSELIEVPAVESERATRTALAEDNQFVAKSPQVPSSHKLIWWVFGGAGVIVVAGIVAALVVSSGNRTAPSVADAKVQVAGPGDQTEGVPQPESKTAALPTEAKGVAPSEATKDEHSKTADKPSVKKKEATPTFKSPTSPKAPSKAPAETTPSAKSSDELADLDAELRQVLVQRPPFEKVLALKGHAGAVVDVALTPDSSRAVTCSDDGDCRCWDLKTGKELSRYEKKLSGKKFCVAITADGKHALVGGEFKAVDVWDVQSGQHAFTHSAPKTTVIHVTVTSNGKWMGAADEEGGVYTYPLLGGLGHTMKLKGKKLSNPTVAFHPKGTYAVLLADYHDPVALVFPTKEVSAHTITIKAVDPGETHAMTLSEKYFVFHAENHGSVRVAPPKPSQGEDVNHTFPRGARLTWETRLDSSSLIRVAADNAFLVMMDDEGRVEVDALGYSGSPLTYQTGAEDISALAAANDGVTVAYGHSNGEVSVWRLPSPAWPRDVRFIRLLSPRFRNGDYDALEAIATRLRGDGKEIPHFPWNSQKSKYQRMIDYLATGTPLSQTEHDQRIKEWLAAHPMSVTVRLVQAKRLIRLGWKARGSGFANTVSEEDWRVFRKHIEDARKIIMPIADADDPPPEVFPLLFEVAKTQSWEREKVNGYIEKLMKAAPTLSEAHMTIGEMFMRRWGGEAGDSERYALNVAKSIGGPAGDAEYAKVALRLRRYFRPDNFVEATRFDLERVYRGIAHLVETAPEDTDLLQEALLLAWLDDNTNVASWCLKRLKPLDRQWEFHIWRSRAGYARVRKWLSDFLPEHRVDLEGGTNGVRRQPDAAQGKAPKERAPKEVVLEIRISNEEVKRAAGGGKPAFHSGTRVMISLIRDKVKSKAIELGFDPNNIGLPRYGRELKRFKQDASGYTGQMTFIFYPKND